MSDEERGELERVLGHRFAKAERLERALTHRSGRRPPDEEGHPGDNERMEFLGDGVVGLVAGEYLLRKFAPWTAGKLSKAKARLVSARALAAAARRLGIGRYLRLGAGEEKTGGREKPKLLADAYEALVGAIYLDGGLDAAAQFLRETLLDLEVPRQQEALGLSDHKSALQEWLQGMGRGRVEYRVVRESGPDHQKTFAVEAWLGGERLAAGEGSNKKEAEQAAAHNALGLLVSRTDAG